MVSLYRDPLAGLRSQIASKRGLVEGYERALSPLLRAMLPSALRRAFDDTLEDPAKGEPDSFEALTRVDAALDEVLRAHDQAALLVPKLRDCPDEVPDPPRPRLRPPWVFEEPFQLGFRAMLQRRVETIAAGAWLVRWDDTMYLARVRVIGAPLVLTSNLRVIAAQPTTFQSTVRTSVPDETPSLEVRTTGAIDGVGRALGLVRDVAVGDATFDARFIVRAEIPAAARALLGVDVIAALMHLAPLGPRLLVRRGLVELSWGRGYTAQAEPLMPDHAIALTLGVRAAIERA